MITLSLNQILELIVGLFTFWVGTYQLSQNIKSYFSWLIFFFFFSIGYIVFTDPLISFAPNLSQYIYLQKITDWPLFFMPVFAFHMAVNCVNQNKKFKTWLISAYVFAIFLTILDLTSNAVLHRDIVRFENFRSIDSFQPGLMMVPFVIYCMLFFCTAIYLFLNQKQRNIRVQYPIIGLIILILTALYTGLAFYFKLPVTNTIFSIGVTIGMIFITYFVVSYYQLVNERNIFDKSFIFRTLVLLLIILIYVGIFVLGHHQLNYTDLVFLIVFISVIIVSHSAYEWTNTFVNDLLFNASSGLSLVTDEEIYQVVKNYNKYERLEDSSLLRLSIVKNKIHKGLLPVDALKEQVKEAIEYFKPASNSGQRTKHNIKYYLLYMITYNEAEEGQILWELGFEEYPVNIMT